MNRNRYSESQYRRDNLRNPEGMPLGSIYPNYVPSGTPLLAPVVLVRSHRPDPFVVAGCVSAVGLPRIAVDQRPQVHRVRGAAYLVFDRKQMPPARRINDVAKAVLVLVVLAKDKVVRRQASVRT